MASGIRSIALKVSCQELEQKRRFALETLGGREVYAEPGLSVLQMPDGHLMELYGPGSSYPDYLFAHNDIVVSFRVQNMEQALKAIAGAGMETVSEPQPLGACSTQCYVRDQQGIIFGLTN